MNREMKRVEEFLDNGWLQLDHVAVQAQGRAGSEPSSAKACNRQMIRLINQHLLPARVSSPNTWAYLARSSPTVMASNTATSLATFTCIRSPFLIGIETANPHCH